MKERDEILEKLEKIDKNTVATLAALSAERDTVTEVADKLLLKEEKRKKQLREAQKSFKMIGFKAREEVYTAYETFAKKEMGVSSLSAFMREYTTLLIENNNFQSIFKEFQILQKNDEKHSQISFFVRKQEFDELNKIIENEGFTISQFTQSIIYELMKNKELRDKIVSNIRTNQSI